MQCQENKAYVITVYRWHKMKLLLSIFKYAFGVIIFQPETIKFLLN